MTSTSPSCLLSPPRVSCRPLASLVAPSRLLSPPRVLLGCNPAYHVSRYDFLCTSHNFRRRNPSYVRIITDRRPRHSIVECKGRNSSRYAIKRAPLRGRTLKVSYLPHNHSSVFSSGAHTTPAAWQVRNRVSDEYAEHSLTRDH